MTPRLRTRLAQLGSFVLAGVLLYLALRGVDLQAVAEALRTADYRWLIPLVGVLLASHLLRAWRWRLLLEALPPAHEAVHEAMPGEAHPTSRVRLGTAFAALMVGYMVNYAAPRLGEVVRSAALARRTALPFSGIVGTVVVERIVDVVVLALGLATVPFLLADRLDTLDALFVAPVADRLVGLPLAVLAGLGVGLLVLAGLVTWQLVRAQSESWFRRMWQQHARPLARSFSSGVATLVRSPHRAGLVVSTLLMWGCYWLAAYLPFRLLGMTEPFGLAPADAWCLMLLGAIGVAIPSPGGVGSYHFITIQALVYLYAVASSAAAAYAVFVHAAQLLLYVAAGALCLLALGGWGRPPAPADSASSPAPSASVAHEKT